MYSFVYSVPHQSLTSVGPIGRVRNTLSVKWETKSDGVCYLLFIIIIMPERISDNVILCHFKMKIEKREIERSRKEVSDASNRSRTNCVI